MLLGQHSRDAQLLLNGLLAHQQRMEDRQRMSQRFSGMLLREMKKKGLPVTLLTG
jgi:hypothetical protein